MADKKKTPEAEDTGRRFDPISFEESLVPEPPPAAGSFYAESVHALIRLSGGRADAGWLKVAAGGRAPNSVQTGLQNAARGLGVKIKTRSRPENGEKFVYISLADDVEADEEE